MKSTVSAAPDVVIEWSVGAHSMRVVSGVRHSGVPTAETTDIRTVMEHDVKNRNRHFAACNCTATEPGHVAQVSGLTSTTRCR